MDLTHTVDCYDCDIWYVYWFKLVAYPFPMGKVLVKSGQD